MRLPPHSFRRFSVRGRPLPSGRFSFMGSLGLVVLVTLLAFASGCSDDDFEQIVGSSSSADVSGIDPSTATSEEIAVPGTDDNPLDVETVATDPGASSAAGTTPDAVPTAVFSTGSETSDEPDTERAPTPGGAFVTAKPSAGSPAPGLGSVFVISVHDEPDGPARTLVHEAPNGSRLQYPLTNPTYFGNPLVLRVVDGVPGDAWIQVQSPVNPGHQTVWVRGTDFDFATTDKRIEIDMADSTLRFFAGNERILATRVATGAEDSPTPLRVTYVNEIIADPGPFGPFVLNLATFSDAVSATPLQAIAIHGTNERDELGEQVTVGTLRAPAASVTELANLATPGTLVIIFDSSDPETDRDQVLALSSTPARTAGS